ncbi:hypothetical protein ACKP2L_04310 [Oenococcus alcoholitolerans]|uniref:hypothetical protein n=1 Tax=Oenococcus alcoholitolerans TaxID=931074 RepID=UPI003F6E6033
MQFRNNLNPVDNIRLGLAYHRYKKNKRKTFRRKNHLNVLVNFYDRFLIDLINFSDRAKQRAAIEASEKIQDEILINQKTISFPVFKILTILLTVLLLATLLFGILVIVTTNWYIPRY